MIVRICNTKAMYIMPNKMTDLTLVYYSGHSLPEPCEINVRNELIKIVSDKYPIISVTQKPLRLGTNICVGDIGRSHYNCYKQIFIGTKQVKTKYVALVEDDTLYNLEHFAFRPPSDDVFFFNSNMRFLEDKKFWHKGQTGMLACIVNAKLLTKVLAQRFEKFPEEPLPRRSQRHYWQEPGRDERLGFVKQNVAYFSTRVALVTLNYYNALDGKKKSSNHKPVIEKEIEFWGKADALKKRLWGE